MATTLEGIEGLKAAVGQDLGSSGWVEVTQDQVNRFADATGDHQWIHVDVERAKAGPFGGPIAHGYLTLSLAPVLLPEVLQVSGISMGVNYGCNKVRFPSPVPVGSKLRLGRQDRRRRGGGRRRPGHHQLHVRGRGRAEAVVRGRGHLPLLRLTGGLVVRSLALAFSQTTEGSPLMRSFCGLRAACASSLALPSAREPT